MSNITFDPEATCQTSSWLLWNPKPPVPLFSAAKLTHHQQVARSGFAVAEMDSS